MTVGYVERPIQWIIPSCKVPSTHNGTAFITSAGRTSVEQATVPVERARTDAQSVPQQSGVDGGFRLLQRNESCSTLLDRRHAAVFVLPAEERELPQVRCYLAP